MTLPLVQLYKSFVYSVHRNGHPLEGDKGVATPMCSHAVCLMTVGEMLLVFASPPEQHQYDSIPQVGDVAVVYIKHNS